jgi:hypothetical protein
MDRRNSHTALIAASLLVGLQSVFTGLVALVLLASGRRLERWTLATRVAHHRIGLGLFVMLIALTGIAIAVFLASGAGWARIAAYAFEGFTVLGALFRIGLHPVPSILSVALAMIVVVLVAGSSEGKPAKPAQPSAPDEPGAAASAG